MASPSGYLLCGTPRTGSTLLCSLLSSTAALGRQESYFREPDEAAWAERLGVPKMGRRVRHYRDFVRAVRAAATTDNGVFAARIMWGSLGRIVEGVRTSEKQSDVHSNRIAALPRSMQPVVKLFIQLPDRSWAHAPQGGASEPHANS